MEELELKRQGWVKQLRETRASQNSLSEQQTVLRLLNVPSCSTRRPVYAIAQNREPADMSKPVVTRSK